MVFGGCLLCVGSVKVVTYVFCGGFLFGEWLIVVCLHTCHSGFKLDGEWLLCVVVCLCVLIIGCYFCCSLIDSWCSAVGYC